MNREPFETMPDVMDVKQIAQALHLSKAGVYNLLNNPEALADSLECLMNPNNNES